jgi:ribosomal 30S subunit maturation factor RimM
MLPFNRACVPAVDIAAGRVTVALPEEILVPGGAEDAP